MKKLSEEKRRRFSIASTMEELLEFAEAVEMSGQKGYPVFLAPFGCEHEYESCRRIESREEMMLHGEEALHNGWFGLVSVAKTWPMPTPIVGKK